MTCEKCADKSLTAKVAALELRVRALEDSLRKHGSVEEMFVDPTPLRVARLKAGWSGADVGLGLGVSRGMVSLWETNPAKHPLPRWRAMQIVDLFKRSEAEPPVFPELHGYEAKS